VDDDECVSLHQEIAGVPRSGSKDQNVRVETKEEHRRVKHNALISIDVTKRIFDGEQYSRRLVTLCYLLRYSKVNGRRKTGEKPAKFLFIYISSF
jgi:hypothetical protein